MNKLSLRKCKKKKLSFFFFNAKIIKRRSLPSSSMHVLGTCFIPSKNWRALPIWGKFWRIYEFGEHFAKKKIGVPKCSNTYNSGGISAIKPFQIFRSVVTSNQDVAKNIQKCLLFNYKLQRRYIFYMKWKKFSNVHHSSREVHLIQWEAIIVFFRKICHDD